MAPKTVALVGKPDSGKTTLMEKLIPELNSRGYRIGTIKHHVHEFEMDRKGKDTWRHKQAGDQTVALSSPTGFGVIRDVDHDLAIEELLDRYYYDVDLVIAEGYKSTSLPKFEVFRSAVQETPLPGRDQTWVAMISDTPLDIDLPCFGLDDVTTIVDLLVDRFITRSTSRQVALLVDGQPVALKPFAESLIRKTIQGMTSCLKGCGDAREITITIHPDQNDADR